MEPRLVPREALRCVASHVMNEKALKVLGIGFTMWLVGMINTAAMLLYELSADRTAEALTDNFPLFLLIGCGKAGVSFNENIGFNVYNALSDGQM